MQPERWQQIEAVYYSILEAPVEERCALLDRECENDADLRREVESLLQSDGHAGDFLSPERLRGHIARIGQTTEARAAGSEIGHYQILSAIGAGAMGEVYLARDTRLDRRVALKVLPRRFTADPGRVARFIREAKAASALNHPNIITIYEIGQTEGTWFIAAEYIDGVTLRERQASRGLALADSLDIAVQCAVALDAAHRAGILHRDVKPENIMIRPDGLVKVVDFGLARMSDAPQERGVGETQAGLVMGTPRYMSPEQARGEPLDGRSDIFSLGSVIYEMTAGRPAFPGATMADVFAALLSPVAPLGGDAPAALEQIVAKALEKDREHRWQSMRELADALERCSEIVRSGIPMAPARRRSVPPHLVFIVAGLLALFGSIFVVPRLSIYSKFFSQSGSTETSPTLIPLTSFGGRKRHPAFSPNGDRIAFSWDGDAEDKGDHPQFHLYIKPAGEGEPKQLTFAPAGSDFYPSWSPDGRSIAFCRDSPGKPGHEIYVVSVDGGVERKVAEGAGLGVSWSADGKTLALAHNSNAAAADSGGLFLLSLETGQRRELTQAHADYLPQFSPDGKWVAFIRGSSGTTGEIFVIPASGGAAKQLTIDSAPAPGVAWTADSRDVVFSSTRKGMGIRLWRSPVDGGSPRLVMANLRSLSYLTIPRHGGRLAYNDFLEDTNIYLRSGQGFQDQPIPGPFGDPAVVALSSREDNSPSISPDGEQFAFVSTRSGYQEIWRARRDGSQPVPLTSLQASNTGSPRWSPDGRWLAFDSSASGKPQVYVIESIGGAPRQLTAENSGGVMPSWSPDGQWIYFTSSRSGRNEIWKISVSGGQMEQLTHSGANEALPAVDGRVVYFTKLVRGKYGIWSISPGRGPESPVAELPGFEGLMRSWGVLKQGIYFLERDAPSRQAVRFFNFQTHRVTALFPVPKLTAPYVPNVSLSPDGRYALFATLDHRINEIVMIDLR